MAAPKRRVDGVAGQGSPYTRRTFDVPASERARSTRYFCFVAYPWEVIRRRRTKPTREVHGTTPHHTTPHRNSTTVRRCNAPLPHPIHPWIRSAVGARTKAFFII